MQSVSAAAAGLRQQRLAGLGAAGGDAGGRVGEDHPVRLEHGKDRPQALAGRGTGGARRRQRGEHLLAGDLPQRGVTHGGPHAEGGQRPAQLGLDGAGTAGPRARWQCAAAGHHLKPGPQLAGHRLRQAGDGAGEPGFDGRNPVVVEHPRLGQHVAHRPSGQASLGQQQGVAGLDRRARGVLQAEQDPYPRPGPAGDLLRPPVPGCVPGDELVEEGGQLRVPWLGEDTRPGGKVAGQVEQHQLPPGHRADRRRRHRWRQSRAGGAAAEPLEHVGEEQLLAVPVRAGQIPASRSGPAAGRLAASTSQARTPRAERDHPAAGQARTGVLVVGPPAPAAMAQPPIGSGDTPGEAVGARVHRLRRAVPPGRERGSPEQHELHLPAAPPWPSPASGGETAPRAGGAPARPVVGAELEVEEQLVGGDRDQRAVPGCPSGSRSSCLRHSRAGHLLVHGHTPPAPDAAGHGLAAPPAITGIAAPLATTGHAVGVAVGAGLLGGLGRVLVAAGAQPGGVVVVPRAAPAARRWGERAARPAPEAVRDPPHRRGPGPTDLAMRIVPVMPAAPTGAGPAPG